MFFYMLTLTMDAWCLLTFGIMLCSRTGIVFADVDDRFNGCAFPFKLFLTFHQGLRIMLFVHVS